MCGIAGYLNLRNDEPPSELMLRQMLAMIRHRGPDQFGIYLANGIGMGNARLSIIDLASGQQPIATEDERFWIVYNGEIFNHRQLRSELEEKGHRFETHCDTEVFVHLFEQEGPACLRRINGQFGVAIWDSFERELFIARDRLGIRPLFYQLRDGVFTFGSEIKALAVHPSVGLELDALALDQIFTGWSCLAPRTAFLNVRQLTPGHFAVISEKGIRVERYWQPNFAANQDEKVVSSSDSSKGSGSLEKLGELLADSTRLRLLADVPVGAYLSGGLDSSIIAAMVRRFATGRVDTFSIAFTDSTFDESEHQRRMARHLGTDHQVVEATHEDIGDIFPDVVWHCETPLLRTAPAPMFLLSRLVNRSGYKVVLTGEGADEFLAGYDIFKEAKIRAFWSRRPESAIRAKLFQRIYPDLHRLSKLGPTYLASFFGERLTEVGAPDYSHAIRWRNTRRIQRFFSADLSARIRRQTKPLLDSVPLPDGFRNWSVLERAQYLEVTTFLSPYLLSSQGDRVAMAHSVEGRFPFLDYRVVEFCAGLSERFKLPALRDKYLLRRLGRKLLPEEICNRPKKPYRAPIHRSFFNPRAAAYVRELMSESSLREAGLFSVDAVAKLLAKVEQGQTLGETDDMALAGVVSSQLLYHRFLKNFRRATPLSGSDDVKVCHHRLVRSVQERRVSSHACL
jgi:asparagine synthase (glutamine-hydrolysing)